jgi:NAD(P)-dependent dehydrogenase (short-subunit alcohol dehydrogenase family)
MSDGSETRRVVAITGAGGALGAAISQQLAGERDTDLVLSDVSAPSLETTVAGLGSTDASVETVLADVSDYAQVESVIKLAVERFGRLDVLISNAGVLSPNGRIHNLATEDWERAFRINVLGAVNGIKAAVAEAQVTQAAFFKVAEEKWEDSGVRFRVNLLGLPCTGQITIGNKEATLEFQLSWYLAHIRDSARAYAQQAASRALAG